MPEETALTSSDAWLLHAVLLAGGSGEVSLEDVVGVADMINHAILTFDEIDGGVARLSRSGLILVAKKRLQLTRKALRLLRGARKLAIRTAAETVRDRLGVPEPSSVAASNPDGPNSRLKSGKFTRADLAKAVKAHHKKFLVSYAKATRSR